MTTVEAPIGAKVQVTAGVGYVRWTGANPGFAAGKWVGVELLEPSGKNDGSVQGQRYFDCKPKHGVFVRPSQVQILELPRTSTSRAGSRLGDTGSGSISSIQSRATSPQKTSASGLRPTSGANTPQPLDSRRLSTSSATAQGTRLAPSAMKRPPSVAERHQSGLAEHSRPPSVLGASPRPPTSYRAQSPQVPPPPQSPNISQVEMPPPPPPNPQKFPSQNSMMADRASGTTSRAISASHSPVLPATASPVRPETPLPGGRISPFKTETSVATPFGQKRELEELRIKVRILENRRTEDQEKIRSLEAHVGEADALRAARVKLQAKFQELQTSLVAAQRLSKDLQSENAHLKTRAADATDQLEMAALDREVAEEKAEAAENEVNKLTERLAELEMEIAVLKEENAEYEKPVAGLDGEKTSLAYLQLEKHNERLKEALIRLRDVSSDTDREQKSKIQDLEKELSSYEGLISRFEMSEAKLGNAEAQIEDLKLQLDDALGAEDMLEQLTDRNLQMSERMEEMRATIEDLEALKDLNDELEENHVEAEKQLNAEIDTLTGQLRDERTRSGDLDGVILDMSSTINQFRDLVGDLQSEIDELRMQQASQENESSTTFKEAQALMNLNLKLQSSAAKTQSKTIELDLKQLEAAQLAEHLKIVTAYLPEPYTQTEADSTHLYLFFLRMTSKTEMIISTISAIHGLPSSLHSASSETLVGVCELRGKLRHFGNLNRRFSAVMLRSPSDAWTGYGKLLTEVAGVEAKVDTWISMIRHDAFSEGDCARDLGSLIAQFDHLADTAFNRPELDVPEQQLGLAFSFDYDLDNFAAAVGFARQAIVGLTKEEDNVIDEGVSSLATAVYEPVQQILDLVRSVKVPSGKLVSEIQTVLHVDSALSPDVTVALSSISNSVSNAVDLAVQLAQRIGAHVASLRATKEPLRLADIETFLDEVTAESSKANEAPPWELISMFVQRIGAEIGALLPKVRSAIKSEQVVPMDIPAPWLARVAAIRDAASFNADTERKVVRLSEELKDMLREIKLRDQSLQESGVKIETLERRIEAGRRQAEQIIELENDVAKAKKQEKVYEDAIDQLQKDLDVLEAENAQLGKRQAGDTRQATGSYPEPLHLGAVGVEASQLAEQVENLRNALRYLRSENALLKSKDLYRGLHLLPALHYTPEDPLPELEQSSPGSPLSETSTSYPVTPTRQSLEAESKLLFREIADFQASSKIVDISRAGKKGWHRRKSGPEEQVWSWKLKEKRLRERVEDLAQRTKVLDHYR
ncbi:dynein associated protein-domain-containing protein [Kockovaella imperatae]|uniref:Dynein associated protein-domain-containing protein n=1 Tax=Kockovaella imperatae TaxID=4999 RepID=A0A1Y1UQ19_9TREE|nr:dynein associated protein-domain-containing protein [Kockovaella imperatae]ORX40158.1 dynein associated protein-domain-containing protein [Kockovaella imperatae]